MWYFSWILGVWVAIGFGVVSALWFESSHMPTEDEGGYSRRTTDPKPPL